MSNHPTNLLIKTLSQTSFSSLNSQQAADRQQNTDTCKEQNNQTQIPKIPQMKARLIQSTNPQQETKCVVTNIWTCEKWSSKNHVVKNSKLVFFFTSTYSQLMMGDGKLLFIADWDRLGWYWGNWTCFCPAARRWRLGKNTAGTVRLRLSREIFKNIWTRFSAVAFTISSSENFWRKFNCNESHL